MDENGAGRIRLVSADEPMPGVGKVNLSTNLRGDVLAVVDMHSPRATLRQSMPNLHSFAVDRSLLSHSTRADVSAALRMDTAWDTAFAVLPLSLIHI